MRIKYFDVTSLDDVLQFEIGVFSQFMSACAHLTYIFGLADRQTFKLTPVCMYVSLLVINHHFGLLG